MNTLTLPSGSTGFTNDSGQWICTGSQMGRRNILPEFPDMTIRLRLQRLPFVDGCYDRWGAYWGSPANLWIAYAGNRTMIEPQGFARVPVTVSDLDVAIFIRANSREESKQEVRSLLPLAKFYR